MKRGHERQRDGLGRGEADYARRSSRQSLQIMTCPFGYSNSHAPSDSKPSFWQIAFDGVVDVWKRMHPSVLVVALGDLDRLRSRRHPDAAALLLGHYYPADLVDVLAAPVLRPEADRAKVSAAARVDDLEHTIATCQALVACLTLAQLV